MIGLQVLAIVELGFLLAALFSGSIFILVHSLIFTMSCRKVSLLARLLKAIERKCEEYKTRSVKMLAPYKYRLDSDQAVGILHEKVCPICCDEFASGEWIYALECIEDKPKHLFHTKCLNIWSRSSEACPTCRTNFSTLKANT